jgi:hypothetical protein
MFETINVYFEVPTGGKFVEMVASHIGVHLEGVGNL